MRSRANGARGLTASPYRCCQSAISTIYSFFMYYYTMPIQRWYFPIFNFVAVGKVAIGIDRVDGQIRGKSCMISCSLHQVALESLRGQRSERKSDCLLVGFFFTI